MVQNSLSSSFVFYLLKVSLNHCHTINTAAFEGKALMQVGTTP